MKEENGVRARDGRNNTEGKSSLKSERSASSGHRTEGARDASAHRHDAVKSHASKKHPHTVTHTVGEARRLELERRRLELERGREAEAELHSRYEEGYRAGFAAGLAARRSETASMCVTPPASPEDSQSLASRSGEHASAAGPHISEATVTSSKPISGDGKTAGATPEVDRSHLAPEAASLEMADGAHIVPVSLKASMEMLREPMPGPLRGSLASLERQNRRLDEEGIQRIEDDSDLEYRIAHHLLVPLPVSDAITVNPELPALRRFCRPWTAEFLTDLAQMHDAVFHRPLRVDSAVRPISYQRYLLEINGNAAPAEGAIASPHETGATVDIAKKGMTWREIGWMRRYLLTLQNAGLIDVEEEFYQSCFHITVYDVYGRQGLLRADNSDGGGDVDRTMSATGPTQGQ